MGKTRLDIERLKNILYEKKITQAALAKMLGLTPAAVSGYFVGRSNPPMEVIEKMSVCLGVPESDFILDENKRDYANLEIIVRALTAFSYELTNGIVSLDIPPESKIKVLEYIKNTFDKTLENNGMKKTGTIRFELK